jgi:hypothetical protein
MLSYPRLPTRFPIGTKYVLEGRGPFVQRYIEFPNGRRAKLAIRKALSCRCVVRRQMSIAPEQEAALANPQSLRKYLVA